MIVRKEGLELTNGTDRIAAIPNVDDAYDLKTLADLALSLKRDYPETDNASVLLEPEVEYDSLVQVMDAIRTVDSAAVGDALQVADASTAPAAGTVPRCVESPWPSPSSRCPPRPRRRRP